MSPYSRIALPILALASMFAACADDPADPATGFTAQGVELTSGTVVVTANGQVVTGDTITVATGSSATFTGQFITANGQRGLPTTSEYSLRVVVADTTVATASVTGGWNVEVRGVAPDGGTTTMTLALLKNGTAVYTSPAIRIVVAGRTSLIVGDTLNYSAQGLDLDNSPDPSAITTQRWVVLATGMSYQGKTDVMMFDRNEIDEGGASIGRDTVYVQTAADGSVYLFDEMRRQFLRQGGVAAELGGALPSVWLKVANTLQATPGTWSGFTPDSITVKNLTIPTSPIPVDLTVYDRATHTGQISHTVPAGTYADSKHTDHTLHLRVMASIIPALADSITGRFNASPSVGVISWSYDSRQLASSASFYGQEVVLQSIRRRH